MKNKKFLPLILFFCFYSSICLALTNKEILSTIEGHFPHFESKHWRIDGEGPKKTLVYAHTPFDDCERQKKRLSIQFSPTIAASNTSWTPLVNSANLSSACKIEIPYSQLNQYLESDPIETTPLLGEIPFMKTPEYARFIKNFPSWGNNEKDVELAKKIFQDYKNTLSLPPAQFAEVVNSLLGEDIVLDESNQLPVIQEKLLLLADAIAKKTRLLRFDHSIGKGGHTEYEGGLFLAESGELIPIALHKNSAQFANISQIILALNGYSKVRPDELFPFIQLASHENSCNAISYYSGGTLSDHISFNYLWILGSEQFCSIVDELLKAAEIMHELKIAHNDLNAKNIFLEWNPTKGLYQIKIGDFGFSQLNPEKNLKFCGTSTNMEPERYMINFMKSNDQNITPEDFSLSDMWSIGEVLYRMLTKHSLPHVLKVYHEIQKYNMREIELEYFLGANQTLIKDFNQSTHQAGYPYFYFEQNSHYAYNFADFISRLLIPIRNKRMNIKEARIYFNEMKNQGMCTDKKIWEAREMLLKKSSNHEN